MSRQVVAQAMNVASTHTRMIERVSQAIATIDVLQGLANIAAHSPTGYCKPQLTDTDGHDENDGTGIVLEDARHPCVECQENVDFIPNHVDLQFDKSSFMLVTGPNST